MKDKLIKIILVIPAHNEEDRIGKTLKSYADYFSSTQQPIDVRFLVVLNGCVDNTKDVVQQLAEKYSTISFLDFTQAGKGFAIIQGFKHALKEKAELIGFVDADMATSPQEFMHLINNIQELDGIIASRYMKKSVVIPPRPFIKRWGSKLIFEPLVRLLLGLHYKDLQCGAKLFKRHVIEAIVDKLLVRQWAFDVELLYLCKKYGFSVQEIPTVWHDQVASKLTPFRSGMRMLGSVFTIRKLHSRLEK